MCFNVAIVDDTLFERTEMFSVVILEDPSLGRLPPRTILLPDVSVIEIIDNDSESNCLRFSYEVLMPIVLSFAFEASGLLII